MPALASSTSPARSCVVCREPAQKSELLRLVRRPAGDVIVSDSEHGRGAYIHRDATCLSDSAAVLKALARSLRRTLSDDAIQQIEAMRTALNCGALVSVVP